MKGTKMAYNYIKVQFYEIPNLIEKGLFWLKTIQKAQSI